MKEKFQHAGYTVRIQLDEDAQSPETYGNTDLFLLTTKNRYFSVQREGFDLENFRVRVIEPGEDMPEVPDYINKYHVFPLYTYIHGGVSLSTSGFSCQWDSGQIGVILVSKDGGFTDPEQAAKSLCDEWNQYLSGDVWGYTVTSNDGEPVDSCCGFYGRDYCVEAAKTASENCKAYENRQAGLIDAMMAI